MKMIELGHFAVSRGGSVDPSKFADETFDLYSIPAYDSFEPEVLKGKDIGSSKKVVEPGDVLISRIVPHIRRVWIVGPYRERRQIASGEWIIFRGDSFDAHYMRHCLLSNLFHQEFIKTVSGVGGSLLRARPSLVEKIKIPLPSLPQQKRIANILDKADAIRRKRQQAIKLADEFLRSVFLDMFGDPVTNSKGWDSKKLCMVGTLDRGVSKHRPRNAPELLGGPYPLVQTGEVANSKGYIRSYKSTYSEIGLKQSKMWPAGTLCITIAANIAKTGMLTFDACFPDSVVGFSPNALSTTEYVQFWLRFLQKILEDSAPESAQKNINLEILRNLDIPLPPVALQKEFSSRVAQVQALKEKQTIGCGHTSALFNALTQRAFQGEL